MTWRQILGIEVEKDKKKVLKPLEVSVKNKFAYQKSYLPLFITYTITPTRFLTNKKGVFQYKFEVTFYDSLKSEQKQIRIGINAKNYNNAKQWIITRLKNHTIVESDGKIINLF